MSRTHTEHSVFTPRGSISDSGPLIRYSAIERLDILRTVLGDIVIPPAVYDEVVRVGHAMPGAKEVALLPWIQVRELTTEIDRQVTAVRLGRGETEAIGLALQLHSTSTFASDDRQARRLGERLGLRVTGSAGVLIEAKRLGVIDAVAPLLNELQEAGLYLGFSDVRKRLDLANE